MTVHQKQQIYSEYRAIARRYVEEMLVAMAQGIVDNHSFILLLKNHSTHKSYKVSTNCKRTIKSVEVYATLLCEINRLLVSGEHATKRDIYYRHQNIFRNQVQLDHALDSIACTFDLPRDALNIHASAKGLVHGDLRVQLEGSSLDCSNGMLIPRDDLVMFVEFVGRFVLVVEKDAIFHTIVADYHHLEGVFGPFAVITGKGYPDLATTRFLSNFAASIPILVMVDLDPHGIDIYLHYLKHAPCHLLGMSSHDIDHFNELSHQRLPITPTDSHKIKCMLGRKDLPQDVRIELMRLKTGGFKAELEIMCEAREPQFFTRTYVTTKLRQGLQQLSSASQPSTRISQ